jgi:hypothetical protein
VRPRWASFVMILLVGPASAVGPLRGLAARQRVERGVAHLAVQGDVDPMTPVAFLEGGTWIGEGTWPDGSALTVEVRYFWGPTKRVLHFETFEPEGGHRKLIYEGILFFDPKLGAIVQYNFKPNGEVDVSQLSNASAVGYEVRGANTHSLVRFAGPDEFHWELRVPDGNDWKLILDATYRRRR